MEANNGKRCQANNGRGQARESGPGREAGRRMGVPPREQHGWLAGEEGRVGQAREEWERGPTAPRGGGQRRGNKDPFRRIPVESPWLESP